MMGFKCYHRKLLVATMVDESHGIEGGLYCIYAGKSSANVFYHDFQSTPALLTPFRFPDPRGHGTPLKSYAEDKKSNLSVNIKAFRVSSGFCL